MNIQGVIAIHEFMVALSYKMAGIILSKVKISIDDQHSFDTVETGQIHVYFYVRDHK